MNKSLLKIGIIIKGEYEKNIWFLISLILLNGCAESVALLGSSVGGVI